MFLGTYHAKFTGKNRIVLPKKLRRGLKGQSEVILTRGLDGCIWGFSKTDWEKEARRQLQIPVTDSQGRFLRRNLFSEAEDGWLDSQGRFIIPANLLEFAGIKEEVALIGAGDHFEIWNPKKWKKMLESEATGE